MKLSVLLQSAHLPSPLLHHDPEISALVCHTERIVPGAMWFCIPGEKCFPLPLLSLAEKRGAVAVMVPEDAAVPEHVPILLLRSRNVRRDMAIMLHRFYGEPGKRLRLHAVTGTNGKTSVSMLLDAALRAAGKSCGWIGTGGCRENGEVFSDPSTMTTPPPEQLYPLLADLADRGVTDVVMEVSSHALMQDRVFPLRFHDAIFTNLTPEHLDYHRSMREYAEAKARLFDQCDIAIVNADSPFADEVTGRARNRLLCGRSADPYFHTLQSADLSGVRFVLHTPKGELPLSLPIPGGFMAQNAMLAAATALQNGVCVADIARAFAAFPGIPGRMERLDLSAYQADFSVMIDFAHTEHALRNLLEEARRIHRGRIVLLFGCGGDRDPGKRAPMGGIAENGADFVYVTSDNCRSESPAKIIRDILSGMKSENHTVIVSRRRAIETAIREARPGDLLILAGKGHETYEITQNGTHPFSEREIVFSAMISEKKGHTEGGEHYADPD